MTHYTLITSKSSGIVYLGLCGNTKNEVLEQAADSFPQYDNFNTKECNCKRFGERENFFKDWEFPY